ncbi:MAG: hypothetical protein HZA03_08465 [Nitrospinae bacterium]|nr:hypothetical protein [Nitrospinota bacterium]
MNGKILAVMMAGLALSLFACQDHHFVPMEKADKIHIPAGTENAPGFAEGPVAQKQVMAEAQKSSAAPAPQVPPPAAMPGGKAPAIDAGYVIVDGTLELGAEQKKMDFKGWTIYVLVRLVDQPAPPLAVTRIPAGSFPVSYVITNANLMVGDAPKPGAKILIEARLDKDGDPISKNPGDVYGFSLKPTGVGDRGVKVVLDQIRR